MSPPVDRYGDPLPPGVRIRLGTGRLKHTMRQGNNHVEAACFSPDGRLLAVAAEEDNRISVWEVPGGRLAHMLDAFPLDRFRPIWFTPDGRWLIAEGHEGPLVWEAGTWRPVLGAYDRKAKGQSFQGRGDRGLAPASRALQELVADLSRSRQLHALSSSGEYLVTGEPRRRTARQWHGLEVWRVADGKRIARITRANAVPGYEGLALSPFVSPDGRWLSAYLQHESSTPQPPQPSARVLWDLVEGGPAVVVLTSTYPLQTGRFSPDSRFLLASEIMGALRAWDCAAGRPCWEMRLMVPGIGVGDGRVAVRDEAGVGIHDLATGARLTTVPVPDQGWTSSLALSPGRPGLLAAVAGNGRIELREIETGRDVTPLDRLPDAAGAIGFTPDGGRLGAAGERSAALWDVTSGRLLARLPIDDGVRYGGGLRTDGRLLVEDAYHGKLSVHDWETGRQVAHLKVENVLVPATAWPDLDLAAFCTGPTDYSHPLPFIQAFELRRLSTGELLAKRALEALAVGFGPGGEVAAFGLDGVVRLLGVDLGEVRSWPAPHPLESPQVWAAIELTFSADGRWLAVGVRSEGRVGVVAWDVASGKALGEGSWLAADLPGVPEIGIVCALRLGFAAGGRPLAAVLHEDEMNGPNRVSILVHDAVTGEQLIAINHGQDPVFDWQFSPDGRALAVTRDNTVEVWDVAPP